MAAEVTTRPATTADTDFARGAARALRVVAGRPARAGSARPAVAASARVARRGVAAGEALMLQHSGARRDRDAIVRLRAGRAFAAELRR